MRPPNEGEPIFTKQKLARTAGALLSAMTLSTIACGPERNPDAASFLYGLGEEGRLQGTPVVPTADGKWEIAQTPTVGSYLFVPMKGRVMGPNDNYLDNRKIPVRKNPNTYGEPAYELDPQQLKANHGVLVLGDSYPGRDGKTTLEINGRERQFGVWLLLTDDQGNSIDPSSGKPSETKYFVATSFATRLPDKIINYLPEEELIKHADSQYQGVVSIVKGGPNVRYSAEAKTDNSNVIPWKDIIRLNQQEVQNYPEQATLFLHYPYATDGKGDPTGGRSYFDKWFVFVATVVVKNSNGTPVGIKEELVYVFVSNLPNNLIKPADGKPSFLPKDFKPLELEAVK